MSDGNKAVFSSLTQGKILNSKSLGALLEADPSLSRNNQMMSAGKSVKGPRGRTRLMHAAFIGDLSRLQELMSFGENVKNQNNRGKTALRYAIEGGKPEAVRFLVPFSDLEDIEMCLLRVNNRIAKIDVDLNPQSGFKGNSEMLRTEKAPLIEIREILAAATPPAASSSLLPGGGGGSNRKRKSRKDRKGRKGRKGLNGRKGLSRKTRRKNRNE